MSRILVVDDDEDFRGLVCQVLRCADYEVLAAADGSAALNLSSRQRVDLAIIDLIMPEKEGIETIIELRRLQPDLSIIAMSGGGSIIGCADCLKMARHVGAARILAKPFAVQEILETVTSLLN